MTGPHSLTQLAERKAIAYWKRDRDRRRRRDSLDDYVAVGSSGCPECGQHGQRLTHAGVEIVVHETAPGGEARDYCIVGGEQRA